MRSPFFQSAMPPLNSLGRVLGEVELVPESRLEPRTMSNECGEERQRDKRQERVLLEQNKTRETTHNKRNPNRQWNSTPVLSTKTRNRAATVCSVILCERHAPLLRRPAAEAENEHRWFTTPPALSAIAPAHTSESSIAAGKLLKAADFNGALEEDDILCVEAGFIAQDIQTIPELKVGPYLATTAPLEKDGRG